MTSAFGFKEYACVSIRECTTVNNRFVKLACIMAEEDPKSLPLSA